MPADDTSLKFALMRAGFRDGLATDVAGKVVNMFGAASVFTLSASSTVTLSPANANVTAAPTGTGTVTVGSAGSGNTTLGASGSGFTSLNRVGALVVLFMDSSGTPGNATQTNLSGRAAFAAGASSVVITNTNVLSANSRVFVSLGGSDATLTSVRVTTAAGSFTVTGNAAATGTTPFDYLIVN